MTGARLAFLAALWAAVPAPARAHGVEYSSRVEQRDGRASVWFRSAHHGTPLAGAWVQVFAPADPLEPRDEGRTDASGLFAFRPDAAGTWRIRAVDATGHGALALVEVAGAATGAAAASPPAGEASAPPPGPRSPSTGAGGPPPGGPGGPRAAAPRISLLAAVAAIVLLFVALAAFHRRRPRA